MKILVWNIHGVAKDSMVNHLKKLICDHRVDIIVLLDMRFDENSMHSVSRKFRRGLKTTCIPLVGLFGGLIALWRNTLEGVDFVPINNQLLHGIIVGKTDALIPIVVHNKTCCDMKILAKEKLLYSKLAITKQKSNNNNMRIFNVIQFKPGLRPHGENMREFY